MQILGVSALYHDSAAALIRDGEIVAAAQEERFTRIKNDASIPRNAIRFCLERGRVEPGGIDVVAYYEKPLNAFVRVLKTYVDIGPRGLRTFPKAMDEALRHKLWASYEIDKALKSLGYKRPGRTVFAEHHLSHAAAAFYPSPFDRACILTFDGVGEWATSSIGVGRHRFVDLSEEMRFPDSIGLLYSAFTFAAGFKVNSGEYKLMGLAPYGEPTYVDQIREHLIDLRPDGSFTMNQRYFEYLAGRRMVGERFSELFDGPPRSPESPITRRECDLARSAQVVVEDIVLRMAAHAFELTGETNAVLGGGVALNCVANGRLLREGPFDDIWIQPAAGDSGSALGCALWAWHEVLGNERPSPRGRDSMRGSVLGPLAFSGDLSTHLLELGRPHERIADSGVRAQRLATLLSQGAVVGVCRGRMEFGPRALGARSILADARDPAMQRKVNRKIKNRESFRPFAPVVLAEDAAEWFDVDRAMPYMSFVVPVMGAHMAESAESGEPAVVHLDESAIAAQVMDLGSALDRVRSPLPAVTHVDGTERLQTVDATRHPQLHALLDEFKKLTGCPVLLNTSFIVRGEPIVCDAEDAYRCFMTTEMDWLLIDDCLLAKSDQPPWQGPLPVLVDD